MLRLVHMLFSKVEPRSTAAFRVVIQLRLRRATVKSTGVHNLNPKSQEGEDGVFGVLSIFVEGGASTSAQRGHTVKVRPRSATVQCTKAHNFAPKTMQRCSLRLA